MLRYYTTAIEAPQVEQSDTFYTLLAARASLHPEDTVAQYRDPHADTSDWVTVSAHEMLSTVRAAAKGLLAAEVKKGDRVVIYSATMYEWGVLDFACAAIGAVLVPIYETDSSRQAEGICQAVNPTLAFADTGEHAMMLEDVLERVDSLQKVYCFATDGLPALQERGRAVSDEQLDEAISKVHTDDIATIVYTSGSTGKPKGAQLTYRNFLCVVKDGWKVLPGMLNDYNRLLLFLPLAHCFARYIQYCSICNNGVVAYVSSAKHLLADLRSFKPTYLLGVPRVFEKVYNAASQKAGPGIKGSIFQKAYEHFVQWSKDEQAGKAHPASERISHAFYMKTVGDTVKDALGPNMAWLACGGAPLNPDLAHFFQGIDGITFIQGYGMTECAAPCIVNFEDANRIGAVGKPGPGIELRISDEGELQIKGDNVFHGYLDDPERTAEAMTEDGWLRSGDLAKIDDDGFVWITGRKKDLIITAGGKNVSPAPLEEVIGKCPIVSHAVVLGDLKPFISALITLDEGMVKTWLKKQHMDPEMSMEQAANNAAVRAYVQQFIDRANMSVSRAESVRKFVILPADFSQEEGTMTPSMKVIRPKVLTHYSDVIEKQIYTPAPGTQPRPSDVDQLFDRMSDAARNASNQIGQAVNQASARVAEGRDSVVAAWKNRDKADNSNADTNADADADAETAQNTESAQRAEENTPTAPAADNTTASTRSDSAHSSAN